MTLKFQLKFKDIKSYLPMILMILSFLYKMYKKFTSEKFITLNKEGNLINEGFDVKTGVGSRPFNPLSGPSQTVYSLIGAEDTSNMTEPVWIPVAKFKLEANKTKSMVLDLYPNAEMESSRFRQTYVVMGTFNNGAQIRTYRKDHFNNADDKTQKGMCASTGILSDNMGIKVIRDKSKETLAKVFIKLIYPKSVNLPAVYRLSNFDDSYDCVLKNNAPRSFKESELSNIHNILSDKSFTSYFKSDIKEQLTSLVDLSNKYLTDIRQLDPTNAGSEALYKSLSLQLLKLIGISKKQEDNETYYEIDKDLLINGRMIFSKKSTDKNNPDRYEVFVENNNLHYVYAPIENGDIKMGNNIGIVQNSLLKSFDIHSDDETKPERGLAIEVIPSSRDGTFGEGFGWKIRNSKEGNLEFALTKPSNNNKTPNLVNKNMIVLYKENGIGQYPKLIKNSDGTFKNIKADFKASLFLDGKPLSYNNVEENFVSEIQLKQTSRPQKWIFKRLSNGKYRIMNEDTGGILSQNENTIEMINMDASSFVNPKMNQYAMWERREVDGNMYITNSATRRTLTSKDGKIVLGYKCDGQKPSGVCENKPFDINKDLSDNLRCCPDGWVNKGYGANPTRCGTSVSLHDEYGAKEWDDPTQAFDNPKMNTTYKSGVLRDVGLKKLDNLTYKNLNIKSEEQCLLECLKTSKCDGVLGRYNDSIDNPNRKMEYCTLLGKGAEFGTDSHHASVTWKRNNFDQNTREDTCLKEGGNIDSIKFLKWDVSDSKTGIKQISSVKIEKTIDTNDYSEVISNYTLHSITFGVSKNSEFRVGFVPNIKDNLPDFTPKPPGRNCYPYRDVVITKPKSTQMMLESLPRVPLYKSYDANLKDNCASIEPNCIVSNDNLSAVRYGDLIYFRNSQSSDGKFLDICGRGQCYSHWDVSASDTPYRESGSNNDHIRATGIWKIYKMSSNRTLDKTNTDVIRYGDTVYIVNMYQNMEYHLDAGCGPSSHYLVGVHENQDREPGTDSSKWTIISSEGLKSNDVVKLNQNFYLQTNHVNRVRYLEIQESTNSGCGSNLSVIASKNKRLSSTWKIMKKGSMNKKPVEKVNRNYETSKILGYIIDKKAFVNNERAASQYGLEPLYVNWNESKNNSFNTVGAPGNRTGVLVGYVMSSKQKSSTAMYIIDYYTLQSCTTLESNSSKRREDCNNPEPKTKNVKSMSQTEFVNESKKHKVGNQPCGYWHWFSTGRQHNMGLPRNIPPVYPYEIYWSKKNNKCVSGGVIVNEHKEHEIEVRKILRSGSNSVRVSNTVYIWNKEVEINGKTYDNFDTMVNWMESPNSANSLGYVRDSNPRIYISSPLYNTTKCAKHLERYGMRQGVTTIEQNNVLIYYNELGLKRAYPIGDEPDMYIPKSKNEPTVHIPQGLTVNLMEEDGTEHGPFHGPKLLGYSDLNLRVKDIVRIVVKQSLDYTLRTDESGNLYAGPTKNIGSDSKVRWSSKLAGGDGNKIFRLEITNSIGRIKMSKDNGIYWDTLYSYKAGKNDQYFKIRMNNRGDRFYIKDFQSRSEDLDQEWYCNSASTKCGNSKFQVTNKNKNIQFVNPEYVGSLGGIRSLYEGFQGDVPTPTPTPTPTVEEEDLGHVQRKVRTTSGDNCFKEGGPAHLMRQPCFIGAVGSNMLDISKNNYMELGVITLESIRKSFILEIYPNTISNGFSRQTYIIQVSGKKYSAIQQEHYGTNEGQLGPKYGYNSFGDIRMYEKVENNDKKLHIYIRVNNSNPRNYPAIWFYSGMNRSKDRLTFGNTGQVKLLESELRFQNSKQSIHIEPTENKYIENQITRILNNLKEPKEILDNYSSGELESQIKERILSIFRKPESQGGLGITIDLDNNRIIFPHKVVVKGDLLIQGKIGNTSRFKHRIDNDGNLVMEQIMRNGAAIKNINNKTYIKLNRIDQAVEFGSIGGINLHQRMKKTGENLSWNIKQEYKTGDLGFSTNSATKFKVGYNGGILFATEPEYKNIDDLALKLNENFENENEYENENENQVIENFANSVSDMSKVPYYKTGVIGLNTDSPGGEYIQICQFTVLNNQEKSVTLELYPNSINRSTALQSYTILGSSFNGKIEGKAYQYNILGSNVKYNDKKYVNYENAVEPPLEVGYLRQKICGCSESVPVRIESENIGNRSYITKESDSNGMINDISGLSDSKFIIVDRETLLGASLWLKVDKSPVKQNLYVRAVIQKNDGKIYRTKKYALDYFFIKKLNLYLDTPTLITSGEYKISLNIIDGSNKNIKGAKIQIVNKLTTIAGNQKLSWQQLVLKAKPDEENQIQGDNFDNFVVTKEEQGSSGVFRAYFKIKGGSTRQEAIGFPIVWIAGNNIGGADTFATIENQKSDRVVGRMVNVERVSRYTILDFKTKLNEVKKELCVVRDSYNTKLGCKTNEKTGKSECSSLLKILKVIVEELGFNFNMACSGSCNDPKSPYKSLCSEYCDKNASPDITCPNGCLNLGKKGNTQMSIEFRKGLVIEKGNNKYKYGIVSNGGPKQQDNLFKITNFRGVNLEIDGKKQRVGTLGKGGIVINNWRMQELSGLRFGNNINASIIRGNAGKYINQYEIIDKDGRLIYASGNKTQDGQVFKFECPEGKRMNRWAVNINDIAREKLSTKSQKDLREKWLKSGLSDLGTLGPVWCEGTKSNTKGSQIKGNIGYEANKLSTYRISDDTTFKLYHEGGMLVKVRDGRAENVRNKGRKGSLNWCGGANHVDNRDCGYLDNYIVDSGASYSGGTIKTISNMLLDNCKKECDLDINCAGFEVDQDLYRSGTGTNNRGKRLEPRGNCILKKSSALNTSNRNVNNNTTYIKNI